MDIADSARRHGIADEDMLHAVRVGFREVDQDSRRRLVIGADRAGRLLEVVVLDPGAEPMIIHAMVLRPKFYNYLR